jgi:hypothetical protein
MIGKTMNNIASHVDFMKEMLPQGLREKVEQDKGRGTTSNNFGCDVDQIGRNMGSGCNNQSFCGHANQAAAQLLQDFTSSRNI